MLHEVIRRSRDDLLSEWRQALRQGAPDPGAPEPVLSSHGEALLQVILEMVASETSPPPDGVRREAVRHLEPLLDGERNPRAQIRRMALLRDLILRRWYQETGAIDPDELGRLHRAIDLLIDTIVDHQARMLDQMETLEHERALFEAVLEQLPAGVLIAGHPDGRLMRVNQRVFDILRSSRDAFPDLQAFTRVPAFHPDDGRPYEVHERPLSRALVAGEVIQDEPMEIQRGDGTRAPVLVRAAPVRRRDGSPLAAVATFCERSRLEEAQRMLADASSILAETLDPSSELDRLAGMVAPCMADWCGIELRGDGENTWHIGVAHRDPLKARALREMGRQWPPRPGGVRGRVLETGTAVLLRDVAQQTFCNFETQREEQSFWAGLRPIGLRSLIVVPLVARGRTLGDMLMATVDGRVFDGEELRVAEALAQRIALAADNARLYAEARAASRLRENVLAIVSHDLKSPLVAIDVNAQLVLKRLAEDAFEKARRHTQAIQQATRLMISLLRDLLDLASIQAGKLRIVAAPCDLRSILWDAMAMYEAVAVASGIRLRVDVPLREVRVRCDRERLLQVLSNLLGNAIKFCPAGASIRLRARVKGPEVRCSVSDTGPGIPGEELARIFDAWWSAERHRGMGTGLGLSITKGIVEMHRGRLWVRSAVGKGTTFYFTLPLSSSDAEGSEGGTGDGLRSG